MRGEDSRLYRLWHSFWRHPITVTWTKADHEKNIFKRRAECGARAISRVFRWNTTPTGTARSGCSDTQNVYGSFMNKRRRALATALMVVAALATGVFAYAIYSERPIPEPNYNGRSLSEWLALYTRAERNGGVPTEAELAVRSIGTNALPFLIASLRYELPLWRKTLLTLATWPVEGKTLDEGKVVYGRAWILGRTARQTETADTGFVILNTNAAPAIPALEVLMKDDRKPTKALRAIWALGEIGGPAVPALTNALADTNQANRCRIMEALYGIEINSANHYRDTPTGVCLPALTRALNDLDPEVRRQAYINLYNLALHKLAPWSFTNASSAQ